MTKHLTILAREYVKEDASQERNVPHQCKKCGYPWMGPMDEWECPKCHALEFTEAAGDKSFPVQCMECGKKFRTSKMLPECPKCGSSDIDLPRESSGKTEAYQEAVSLHEGLLDLLRKLPSALGLTQNTLPPDVDRALKLGISMGPAAMAQALKLDYTNPMVKGFIDIYLAKMQESVNEGINDNTGYEASSLGWAPGKWPTTAKIDGDSYYRGEPVMEHGELTGVKYIRTKAFPPRTITVYND